ncbi:MAG TPA: hypothetical protein DC054_25765 [Blastocatellia bacterium]|nr:hypothetical protein [Blastocatellia bacterium]
MNLNDLLEGKGIDPRHVLVLRHRPHEPELNKVIAWLAADKPVIFNAFQQTQSLKLERAMHQLEGNGYVASFIGQEPGKATFVGLYSIAASRLLTYDQFWEVEEYKELKKHGMEGWKSKETDPSSVLWFDLILTDFYPQWKGKLIVNWPPPERVWWRRAHLNDRIEFHAILEDSALDPPIKEWDQLSLTWDQLNILPKRLQFMLNEWRGIYYIFDTSDDKGYVGSAYGDTNLLGRWLDYADRGDGGNKLLRHREPRSFRFSILQLVSKTTPAADVIHLEGSWKVRLHTKAPHGLNAN